MDKDEALELLRRGDSHIWNQYRKDHPSWTPDFEGEDLSELVFAPQGKEPFDLTGANLTGAKLPPLMNIIPQGGLVNLLGIKSDRVTYMLDAGDSLSLKSNISGALVNLSTTIEGDTNLDVLIQLGAVFVTSDELARQRAPFSRQVFISYAWANEDVVLAIEQWLRQKGINTKIDKRDFFAGSRIRDEIMRNMKDSDAILVFHSEQSKDKPWPQFEREFASDLEMAAKQEGKEPPRIIYVVIDEIPLPSLTESNRIAIQAKGKSFETVCEEIYHNILEIPRTTDELDLDKWKGFVF